MNKKSQDQHPASSLLENLENEASTELSSEKCTNLEETSSLRTFIEKASVNCRSLAAALPYPASRLRGPVWGGKAAQGSGQDPRGQKWRRDQIQAIPSLRESQLSTGGPALHYCLSVSSQVLYGKGNPDHHIQCLYHIRCSAHFTIIIF